MKKHRPRSTAQKVAHAKPRARTKPKAVVRTEDPNRTTFGKLKKGAEGGAEAGEGSALAKGRYEKLAGTRIQLEKGGTVIRVVVEDGTRFTPDNVFAAKQHMAKLAKRKAETAEISRLRGDTEAEAAITAQAAQAPVGRPSAATLKRKKREVKKSVKAPTKKAPAMTKKQRREMERDERRRVHKELKVRTLAESPRELVPSPEGVRFTGEVVERGKGFAWVRLDAEPSLPDGLGQRIRETLRERRPTTSPGDEERLVLVWFFDVEDASMNLQNGVRLALQLYTDKHGVGGCSVVAAPAQPQPPDPEAAAKAAAAAAPAEDAK